MDRIPAPANPKLFAAFSLYALFLAVFGAIVVEQVKHWAGLHFDPGVLTAACVAMFLLVNVAYDRRLRGWLRHSEPIGLFEDRTVKASRGLMLLVSRGDGVRQATWAIQHHRTRLTHLWLIHSSDSEEVAKSLRTQTEQDLPAITVRLMQLPNLGSVELAKQLVEQVQTEAKLAGLDWDDLICDFTGMTKPVSAGVVLANVGPHARLQYMEPTKTLPDGRPDPEAPSKPVGIRLNYDPLERAEPE